MSALSNRTFTFVLAMATGLTFLAAPSSAWAEEPSVIETALPEARAGMIDGEGVLIKVGEKTYSIARPQPEDRALYIQLPDEDRASFKQKRMHLLQNAAKALQVLRFGFGIGSITKEKLVFTYRSLKQERELARTGKLPSSVQEEARLSLERSFSARAEAEEALIRRTLAERSDMVIERILQGIDRNIWHQAPLVAHSNEFGMMSSIGIEALGGVSGKGGFGGLFNIGVSIGYNRETRALVIQVFRDFEKFQSTAIKAVFVAGVLGKLGMYVAAQTNGELNRRGTSFYPPVVPGYSSTTPRFFSTGLSSGLTIPPSPFGDMMTYTNSLNQQIVLRVTISPIMKGFVRVQSGFGQAAMRYVIEKVSSGVESVRSKLGRSGILCRDLFAAAR